MQNLYLSYRFSFTITFNFTFLFVRFFLQRKVDFFRKTVYDTDLMGFHSIFMDGGYHDIRKNDQINAE